VEGDEGKEGRKERTTTGPKKPTTPGGISLFTSREMPPELKSREYDFFQFVIVPSSSRISRPSPVREKNARLSEKISQRIFRSRIFTVYFLPRVSSRRELPRLHIFFHGVNCPSSQISRYAFSILFFLSLDVSAFLSRIFSSQILSRHAFFHLTYLSTHFFPPNTFFLYREFSRYTPVYFSCFLTRSLLHVFFHHPRSSITAFLTV